MHKLFFFLLCSCSMLTAAAQTAAPKLEVLTSGTHSSLRGLSVVSDKIVWVSGSNGTVGRSRDGGRTWQWIVVAGYEKKDFRDIEAFDARTAIIMAIASPAVILKTTDTGKSWHEVYSNDAPGMFLDAMEFWNKDSGIVLGDPINGRFFVARSFDGGNSWHEIPTLELPKADSGEACFASSGTNVRKLTRSEACFISGGLRSRLFIRDKQIDLPILQGKESTGANSIAVQDEDHMVVVGGDFAHDTSREKNCVITHDRGNSFTTPVVPPHGYRSCVEYFGKDKLICCGTSGVDISTDGGMNWQLIDGGSFHVCRMAKKGKAVFLAGRDGKVARLIIF